MSEEGEKELKEEKTKEHKVVDTGSSKTYAFFAYMGPLILVPFLNAKDDPFVKFHLKQGLVIAVAWVVLAFFMYVPILMLMPLLYLLIQAAFLFLTVLSIIGILNVLNGDRKELPLVGVYAKRFDI